MESLAPSGFETISRPWLFSFRFDRRGTTNLWAVARRSREWAPVDYRQRVGDVRFEVDRERLVWIEVQRETASSTYSAEEEVEAEAAARAFFKRQRPGAALLP
jgi:hypothetical protein